MALGKLYFRTCDACGSPGPVEVSTAHANAAAKRKGFRKVVYRVDRYGRKSYVDRCRDCRNPTAEETTD